MHKIFVLQQVYHEEAWNKLIVKQKFCASSWLITGINILRPTVSKTSKKKKKEEEEEDT